ncbi:MAG: flagellar hook assembly protein FlgD [Pseudobacteriovorax sp.]|nr:flagellar hook assembly protein FlgD [Pseudobacteriovorax sp.]
MSELSGAMQSRIAPPENNFNSMDFSSADVVDQTETETIDDNRTAFKDLIANSQDEIKKEREAKKFGDLSADTDKEFFEKLAEQTKQKREVKKEMDKDDFLKLFVSQLQNQDPLNPDDGTEMASKLAQFNGLEQMMNMNKTMEDMVKSQSVGRNLQMVNYVGKEIAIAGGRAQLRNGEVGEAEFNVPSPISRSTLSVRDSTGAIIAERELGPMDKGDHPLKWDGKTNTGQTARNGLYTFSILARNVEGEEVEIPITSKTKITGVDIQSESGSLYTDLGEVSLEEIKSVGDPGYDRQSERPAEKAADQLSDTNALEAFRQAQAERAKKAENTAPSTQEPISKTSSETSQPAPQPQSGNTKAESNANDGPLNAAKPKPASGATTPEASVSP